MTIIGHSSRIAQNLELGRENSIIQFWMLSPSLLSNFIDISPSSIYFAILQYSIIYIFIISIFRITASDGILDWKLNSILDEYHTLFTQHSDNLILDSAQEIQSCTTISQRDFCSPFSMFFLLDQSISWVDNDAKRNKKPEGQTDEEAEQSDDAIVDLYLNLLQPKPIQELLSSNGFELTEKPADSKAKKPTKKKQPKNKAAKSEKIDEEVLKKIKEDNDKIEKETKEKRREILRNVFQKEIAVHQERASVLWNEFTTTIVKMLNTVFDFVLSSLNDRHLAKFRGD